MDKAFNILMCCPPLYDEQFEQLLKMYLVDGNQNMSNQIVYICCTIMIN